MRKKRNALIGLVAGLVLLGSGVVAQKRLPTAGMEVPSASTSPQLPDATHVGQGAANPSDDPGDVVVRRNLEALRVSLANTERQKAIVRDSERLLQASAELQMRVAREEGGVSREESLRQVDAIEKLARSVKEKMRGSR